jgi:hypothetical protein
MNLLLLVSCLAAGHAQPATEPYSIVTMAEGV